MPHWEIAYRGHVAAYRFNKKLLSLDRLNLGPTCRLVKNKPKWKEDKQRKSQQKGRWKAIIQLVLKDTEWPDHFRHKKKGNCKSAYLWRKVHILYIQKIQIPISPKKQMEVKSLFSKLRPNYQLKHCINKRKNEYNIFYASGQNLPWLNKNWKLCGLLTQTSTFSTSYRLWLNK